MKNSIVMFFFFFFFLTRSILFFRNLFQKSKYFKLKFRIQINLNMQNSMAIFIFLVWKYPLCVNLIQNFKRVILRQNLVPTLECLIDIIDFFPNPNLKQYTYTDFFVQFHVKKPTQNKKTTTYYQLLTLTSFCRSNQIFVDVFTECIAWLY